jgi:hypothetical protein
MFMLQQSQKGDLKDDMFCPQNRLSLFFKELFQFLESFFEDLSGEQNAQRLYLGDPPRIS